MRLAVAFGLLAAISEAQPVVSSVQNNYSYLLPGLPNYGIAQGSIFVLFGSNLSTASSGLQSAPLRTSLENVSVSFTVAGQTRAAFLYYVTPSQIAGILPSSTPLGVGTVVVNSNGRSSAAATVRVVPSAFGILTLNRSGTGPAAVLNALNNQLSEGNATHPGDVIVLYGTGAGPTQGDESIAPVQTNLAAVPILVEIGGRPAQVLYHGRTSFPGLDQINVVVPALATPGCAVTLTVTSENFVSNFTTIPVAAKGPDCPEEQEDPELTITNEERGRWIAEGRYTTGSLMIFRALSYTVLDIGGREVIFATGHQGRFTASFRRITGNIGPLLNNSSPRPKSGSCIVSATLTSPGSAPDPAPDLSYKVLDAGAQIDATGPEQTLSAFKNPQFSNDYVDPFNSFAIRRIPSGLYTVSGSGGLDIGPFSASINLQPELEWTNRSSLSTVDRASPLVLTWSNGDPSSLVLIQGSSSIVQGHLNLTSSFQCWARNSDGTFTVPLSVLKSMIPSPTDAEIFVNPALTRRGRLGIASEDKVRIRPTGLDFGLIESKFLFNQATTYK